MIIRAINTTGDFTFGNGKGNYKTNNTAIAQNIQSRLNCFIGDCFFELDAGLDWYNLLGYKDQIALRLAVSAVILNTTGVTGLKQMNLFYDPKTRNLNLTYKVQTTYSTLTDTYQFGQGF